MDATHGRMARTHGCSMCCWWKQTVTISGAQPYGLCVVNPPRTSTHKFPSVMAQDYCGGWTPRIEFFTPKEMLTS